jgi:16S rRNA (cytidine1402-2'-O)-methyltransferase
LIFFESAQRLGATLKDMAEIFGNRPAAVARELTKLHEEVRRGSLTELAGVYENEAPRGEVTLLVGPPLHAEPDFARAEKLLKQALLFMPVRAAADLVAEALEVPRRETYARALALKTHEEG